MLTYSSTVEKQAPCCSSQKSGRLVAQSGLPLCSPAGGCPMRTSACVKCASGGPSSRRSCGCHPSVHPTLGVVARCCRSAHHATVRPSLQLPGCHGPGRRHCAHAARLWAAHSKGRHLNGWKVVLHYIQGLPQLRCVPRQEHRAAGWVQLLVGRVGEAAQPARSCSRLRAQGTGCQTLLPTRGRGRQE